MARQRALDPTCPCGLPETYDACCGAFHRGASAPTPERLMRSRFSAFAIGDAAYLLRTWHPTTRPPAVTLDPAVRWTRLEVLRATGGRLDTSGTVAFRAHSKVGGRAQVQEEDSRFVRQDGEWLYLTAASAPGHPGRGR